jgi:hypothetical protein
MGGDDFEIKLCHNCLCGCGAFYFFIYFFQFCDVVTLVIIHKEILAMFGYRLTFKVEFD